MTKRCCRSERAAAPMVPSRLRLHHAPLIIWLRRPSNSPHICSLA